jgi:ribosomal protein L24E
MTKKKLELSKENTIYFVDLNKINKKVNEGDLPRSLVWPTRCTEFIKKKQQNRCAKKGPELKINISVISIVNFVDLNKTNKKVNEDDLPRSLIWPTEVVKGSKNSLF